MILFLVILAFLAMAAGLAYYLIKRDQGEREPVGVLWTAFGFGMVGVVIAAGLEAWLLPGIPGIERYGFGTLAIIALGIGIIEELAKSLPLMWFIYKRRYFNEHTDGVIYFALAGLGFGLPENILYTFQYGAEVGMSRIVMTPLFHAATTGMIGYALARRKLDHTSRYKVVAMVAFAILVHGIYDFGLFSKQPVLVLLSIMITVALGLGLFLLFLYSRSLDQAQGLSVVGHNAFCRTCGQPNLKHKLYCSHCGNHA
jgi:RsiW-degrading membrane proteinase PrsW (M82 family)